MPKYSIQAEEQSLFAFLKQAFFKMPSAVRVFAYLVFLFLFTFLTLYEFLGFTYYEGKVIYVAVNQQNPSMGIRDARPPRGMRVFKGDRDAYVNERGEFVIGIRSITIPFLTVNFDFDDGSPEGEETVPIPTPLPVVSLFNPNEREIYYVPGNTLREADDTIRHYFLDRKEAHEALKKSLQKSQPASSALPATEFTPSIVHAAEPAPSGRTYFLALRQLKVSGNDDDALDIYFEVRIDGLPVRVEKLATIDSSELSRVKISHDAPYQFSDVSIRIPETAGQVEIAVFQRRGLFQKDQLVGSLGLQPRNTGIGPVTLSNASMQLNADFFPPIAVASASAPGQKDSSVVVFGLDIPGQFLSRVKSVQYDLGPGFEETGRIIKPPAIERSNHFAYAIAIFAAQPINAHVDFEGGGSLDLKAFCDIKTKTPVSPMEHYLLGRAYSSSGQRGLEDRALAEANAALQADATFEPALVLNAAILGELGRFDEAVAAYRRVLQLESASPNALNGYAWLIADKLPQPTHEQLDDARIRVQQAISLSPDPNYYDTLGWTQFKLHNYREALDALKQAKEKLNDPTSSVWQEIHYHMALTYLRMGKSGEAKDAFREVVNYEKFPSSRDAYVREAKSQLSTLQARLTPTP
jgi:tetratricopeptide (TPR) repeat protein